MCFEAADSCTLLFALLRSYLRLHGSHVFTSIYTTLSCLANSNSSKWYMKYVYQIKPPTSLRFSEDMCIILKQIQTYTRIGIFGGDRCPILPDGESGSWFASPAEWYSRDPRAMSSWILSNKSTIQFVFFLLCSPLSLSPHLSSSGFYRVPPHLFHLAVQVIQCLKCQLRWFHWGWFWKCLSFPGLGHQFLFCIRFCCWGLWGHIHLQELVYEIRLSSEKKNT